MVNSQKAFALLWIFLSITLLLGNRVDAADLDYLQGLNQPDYHRLHANALERDFHIYVRVPEQYDQKPDHYPVVYLLDGGQTFPMLGSFYRYLSFAGDVPDLIIVGIAYGTDDWKQGNLRSTDFTAKSTERAHYGGAPFFQQFLAQQLLPFVEEKYRTDNSRRIIFGQSLGGQFVLYSALTKPDLFWGHIASNPALHRNLPFFLEAHHAVAHVGSKVFVSSGSNDDPRFRDPALKWMDHWASQKDKPWQLATMTLEGENHFSAAPTAFRRGLTWLFKDTLAENSAN